MDKPTIYLDIDGVLVENGRDLANHAAEFIEFLVRNFDVYWLTTHCTNNDPTWAIEYIDRISDGEITEYLEEIEPTSWSLKKTEAINFDQPFLWFDDVCYPEDSAALKERGKYENWVEVDLVSDPDQLKVEMADLKRQYIK